MFIIKKYRVTGKDFYFKLKRNLFYNKTGQRSAIVSFFDFKIKKTDNQFNLSKIDIFIYPKPIAIIILGSYLIAIVILLLIGRFIPGIINLILLIVIYKFGINDIQTDIKEDLIEKII